MPVFGRGRYNRGIRVNKETELNRYNPKVKSYRERHPWHKNRSTLNQVETFLGFSISDFISKRSKLLRRPIVVLDWGCGNGRALRDIARKFKQNVKLYGFSKDSFSDWNRSKNQITFIQETSENTTRFFSKVSVDLIYSHYGLNHLYEQPKFEKFAGDLIERLSVGGVLVFNAMDYERDSRGDVILDKINGELGKRKISVKLKTTKDSLFFERVT